MSRPSARYSMYFEINRKDFFEILNLDANLNLLLEEEMMPIFDQGKSDAPLDSLQNFSDSLDVDPF